MEPWIEPTIDWRAASDSSSFDSLLEHGERLAQWPPAVCDPSPTDCLRVGRDFWIIQPHVGAFQFRDNHAVCVAYPFRGVDPSWFTNVVTRAWLPAVYQVWGRQVLHASAVVYGGSRVVAFAGPTQAGKSTLAYGLGRRPSTALLTDDTLAFSINDGRVELHPFVEAPRLRPRSAAYFGVQPGAAAAALVWPSDPVALDCVYFVEGVEDARESVEIVPLAAVDAYCRLLQQAHAFALTLPEHNQRLMRDYLGLAAAAPIFALRYRRRFEDLDRVLDAIEAHRCERTSDAEPVPSA